MQHEPLDILKKMYQSLTIRRKQGLKIKLLTNNTKINQGEDAKQRLLSN